jgi:hypothetical protein
MAYYDIANLVSLIKTNLIRKIPCGYGTQWTIAVRIRHYASCRGALRSQVAPEVSVDLCRGLHYSKIWMSHKSNVIAFWMHLQNCRSFHEHQRMLLQSVRALCIAQEWPGSIWNFLEALVMSTRVSGRFDWGFQTDLDFGDGISPVVCRLWIRCIASILRWPHKWI